MLCDNEENPRLGASPDPALRNPSHMTSDNRTLEVYDASDSLTEQTKGFADMGKAETDHVRIQVRRVYYA